jgi:hypothetical protein
LVALPFALRDYAGVDTARHGYICPPVLLAALAVMVPLVVIAEKRRLQQIFLSAVTGIGLAEPGLALFYDALAAVVILLLFFVAFNVLEALLPSLIAKFAPRRQDGHRDGRLFHLAVPQRLRRRSARRTRLRQGRPRRDIRLPRPRGRLLVGLGAHHGAAALPQSVTI